MSETDAAAETEYEIRDLIARAAWSLDDWNASAFTGCFTPNAMIVADGQQRSPLDYLSDHASEAPVLSRQLWNSGLLLSAHPDGVAVRSYGTDLSTPKGNPSIAIRRVTEVLDTVIRGEGGWLIASRIITPAGVAA